MAAPFHVVLTHPIAAVALAPVYVARFVEEPGCHFATPFARELEATAVTSGDQIIAFRKGRYTAIRNDAAS